MRWLPIGGERKAASRLEKIKKMSPESEKAYDRNSAGERRGEKMPAWPGLDESQENRSVLKFNLNFKLTYKGQPNLKPNTSVPMQGDVKKTDVYVKFKAQQTGELSLNLQNLNVRNEKKIPVIYLCDSQKKEINDGTKRYYGSYGYYYFGVEKGKTYYLKLTKITQEFKLSYSYTNENIPVLTQYGASKASAAKITADDISDQQIDLQLGYIGLSGKQEEQWFFYENTSGGKMKFYVDFTPQPLGWDSKKKQGFSYAVYDAAGNQVTKADTDLYVVVALEPGEKAYVKVNAQKKCPTKYKVKFGKLAVSSSSAADSQ